MTISMSRRDDGELLHTDGQAIEKVRLLRFVRVRTETAAVPNTITERFRKPKNLSRR